MKNAATKPKRRTEPAAKKQAESKQRAKKAGDFVAAYKKYFIAPSTTPDTFRICDLSDDSNVSYSSHT